MVKIRNQIVQGYPRTSRGTNNQTAITVHETANTSRGADAQAHANLQTNGGMSNVSWHIQVDDKEAIRSYPNSAICWHSGSSMGNSGSVGVEICVNSDGDYQQALRNAAEVVQQLRAELQLDRSEVVQHNRWSGKHCPTKLRESGQWVEWLKTTDPGSSTGSTGSSGAPAGKTTGQLASEVLAGKHGTGKARQRSLGSRYNAVQAEVNRRSTGSTGSSVTVGQAAQQIIMGRGSWGDEPQRSRRLRAAGLDPAAVQREVNRRMS